MSASRANIDRVVVISDDAVESGGAAGIALTSVRLLRDHGVPVTLLNGSSAPAIEIDGVEVVSLGSNSILQGGRAKAATRGLFNADARRFIDQWISENDTPRTVYHLHNWHKVLSPAIFMSLRSVSSRLVMTAHDYFLVCPNGGQFDYPQGAVCERVPMSGACLSTNCDRRHYAHKLWRVARQLVRLRAINFKQSSATVIAVHEGMHPYLTRGGIPKSRIATLRNPVTPWLSERLQAEHNREVFYIGRLEKDKGVDVVAAAARKAGLPMCVIGDGPLRKELADDHPHARLLGWRSPKDIAGLIKTARVLVVATRWRETFGLVTLEAIMSGLPVVVSRHALIAPEVAALGCAESCDPDRPDAMAGILSRLSQDDQTIQRMSEAGFRQRHQLAPTPTSWCESLIALYQRQLDGDEATTLVASAERRKGLPIEC